MPGIQAGKWARRAIMSAYNLIGNSLVALAALSIATDRARANWTPSARDWKIGGPTAVSDRARGLAISDT